ncbi:MAG TPA: 1-deoxy-D-xylulose-5-phosphate reductoisomerase [Abditibacteriaceae bacterium]|jgi:1-deoxy-D-xylulose-5-phosphate reductoisomerase
MSEPKPIVILGSTGSIGVQALAVAKALPQHLRVVGLAAGSNVELFAQQIAEWQPEIAALHDEKAAQRLGEYSTGASKIVSGSDGVQEVATWPSARLVLGAMLGSAGLTPTLAAIEAGKDIAIANKETLVAAGEIVVEAARRKNVALLPVDSEHSAIAQCLLGEERASVARLTITASGGPFADTPRAELEGVVAAQALKHPTWSMGRKITVDSASLMNKGLESIEARWLFDVPMEQIDVVVHRQSIVHSLVTFCDGSVKAQLGVPDMRLPIQWALLHPQRVLGNAPQLDIMGLRDLTFEAPDVERFPALELARHAAQMGGVAPAMMNAANEVAVEAFLEGRTGFYGISDCIGSVLERTPRLARPALNDIYAADYEARKLAREWLTNLASR